MTKDGRYKGMVMVRKQEAVCWNLLESGTQCEHAAGIHLEQLASGLGFESCCPLAHITPTEGGLKSPSKH